MERLKHNDLNGLKEFIKKECYLYKEEKFTLVSGKKSNHYFNMKKVTMSPIASYSLNSLMLELIGQVVNHNHVAQAFGGLTMGADPMIYGICELINSAYLKGLGEPIYPLIVRKEPKKHGTSLPIEGYYEDVQKVIVLEDVTTTGGSAMKAVTAFREAGIKVEVAFSILDREEGGKAKLAENGVELHSLFSKSDFGIGD